MKYVIDCRYELDDNEIVTLLNKTQMEQLAMKKEGDETISVNRTIRCAKCKEITIKLKCRWIY